MNKNEIIKAIWAFYHNICNDIAVGSIDENGNGNGYLEFVPGYDETEQFNDLLSLLCEEKIWNEFM